MEKDCKQDKKTKKRGGGKIQESNGLNWMSNRPQTEFVKKFQNYLKKTSKGKYPKSVSNPAGNKAGHWRYLTFIFKILNSQF